MPYGGGDFGFVGQSYIAPDVLQNAEEAINWYIEHDPTETPKMPNALLGCQGLGFLLKTKAGKMIKRLIGWDR